MPAPATTTVSSTSDEPIGTTTGTTTDSSVPVHISIDSIGVDSDLMSLGLQQDGTMEVPPGGFPAGWYDGSPTPGDIGPAVVAGHVDWGGSPGVFFDLKSMKPAETISITRSDSAIATFAVTSVQQYPKSAFPTDSVYGDLDHAGLRLITCGGAFDDGASSYDDNVVVYADLVGIS